MGKILEKKILWAGKFLRSMNIRYRDSKGKVRDWEAFDRPNCNGVVVIVPVTAKGEAVLIRQFRPAVNGYVMEFPAGLNDKGESLEEAAKRELREETGYSAKEMVFLAEGPVSSGSTSEILTVYLAKGLEFKGIDKKDETEDIEVLNIPIPEFYGKLSRMEKEGNKVDLKVFGLMELAKRRLAG